MRVGRGSWRETGLHGIDCPFLHPGPFGYPGLHLRQRRCWGISLHMYRVRPKWIRGIKTAQTAREPQIQLNCRGSVSRTIYRAKSKIYCNLTLLSPQRFPRRSMCGVFTYKSRGCIKSNRIATQFNHL